ncbi:MAG TPA: hypothetical protein VGI08_00850, partial [Diaminobutyricibacter sp.]
MGWATSCVFRELVNGYGVAGSVARAGNTVDSRTDAAMATLFSSVNSAVSAFAPPSALWEPSAGSINGASTCNQLATPAQITTVFPIEGPHEAKGEGGEDAISTLGAAQLVDSYYCILTATSGTFSLELAVLPGGALYVDTAERTRVASGGAPGQAVTGVGDRALYDQKTGTLDVVAGGGWVQVGDATARLDQLTAMAKAVLANLGYH